nr:formin-like protein 3 [Aegilops tauschii subsp. strangulata]
MSAACNHVAPANPVAPRHHRRLPNQPQRATSPRRSLPPRPAPARSGPSRTRPDRDSAPRSRVPAPPGISAADRRRLAFPPPAWPRRRGDGAAAARLGSSDLAAVCRPPVPPLAADRRLVRHLRSPEHRTLVPPADPSSSPPSSAPATAPLAGAPRRCPRPDLVNRDQIHRSIQPNAPSRSASSRDLSVPFLRGPG